MKGFFIYGSPIIELNIENKKLQLLLDTGFNGQIMLPKKLIRNLNLEPIGFSDYLTVSREKKLTKVYKCKIEFFNETIEMIVLSTDSNFSLAGMELFHKCRIIIERHKDLIEINKTD